MNELMQKILLKAQQQAAAETIQNSLAYESKVYEKFAELLIRECMSVADLPKNSSGQWDHLESSEVIARHFGVE